ncbi:MAG: hypothetical protein K1W10_07810 [Lachnospiraceae bacterium]
MERGLGRKISGITFDRTEIRKAVTANRQPSKFWQTDQVKDGLYDDGAYSCQVDCKLSRSDIEIAGTLLKKPAE